MEKYKFEVPEGISAIDEIKLRYGGRDGLNPISYLLIMAGYSECVIIKDDGKLHTQYDRSHKIFCEDWAEKHSEEWMRYQFDRWGELRNEIWEGIKQRRNDPVELRNFVWGLLHPFKDFYFYDAIQCFGYIEERLSWEAYILVKEYCTQSSFSVKEFIALWKRAVDKTLNEHDDSTLTLPEYEKALMDNLMAEESNVRQNDWLENEEASAFQERSLFFPIEYAGRIAGCLLGNNAKKEYMDYQEELNINLVDYLSVFQVASAMDWTEQAVKSLNPKKLIDFDELEEREFKSASADSKNLKDVCEDPEIGTVSFGDIKILPLVYQSPRAAIVWEKAYVAGYINKYFHWLQGSEELAYFKGQFYLHIVGNGRISWKKMEGWEDCQFQTQNYSKFFKSKSEEIHNERAKINKLFAD